MTRIPKILMVLGVLLLGGVAAGAAGADAGVCNLPKENIYANADLSLEDTMELYHATMNEKFNEYITEMLSGQKSAAEAGKTDLNANPPVNGVCDAGNYSTWCIANTLLANGTYGYMEYSQSLTCRRTQIFDTIAQEEDVSQGAKALEVSARMDAIDREIQASKKALDTTLSAYEELKTAWPLHQRYRQVYQSLLKYRDKMVEVRHQVEAFPAEFIDATTTQCT